MNGARAALTMVAPLLGAEQAEPLAQGIQQSHPGLYMQLARSAVDLKIDRNCGIVAGLICRNAERCARDRDDR